MAAPKKSEPAGGEAVGRHSCMLEKAIDAALASGDITDADMGMVSIARAAAYALDQAEASNKPTGYLAAQLIGPYREALAELRMTPATRVVVDAGDDVDPMGVFLDDLANPA